MTNPNKFLVRRYALAPVKPLPTTTGQPIHKLVHHAMFDAAHEAGVIPPDTHGSVQYDEFAKYRDLAHKELSDPNSPFTKMFNRHKREATRTPNPQEHIKKALVPMFKYLAEHGHKVHPPSESPEPIDLLHSGYHPFDEGEKGPFEYHPHVPSGFVELPPEVPKGKRKAFPHRNDVYKSIAEHEDMGWSAPSKLKDYLVEKHGITPQEASIHIANFKRRQKKPNAPTPTPTKRIWPPVQRKSKADSTDLMALPETKPIKNAAFRAPKGGAIIRGTQYKGGSMIPDMTSPFMNPRRKAVKGIK